MPTCRKCNVSFPNFVEIDGKKRNLSKRYYCIDCSPWGLHNTRKVETEKNVICQLCQNSSTERGRKLCKGCIIKVRRWRLKIAAINHLGSKCKKCGLAYNGNISVFDFHHRDGNDKDYTVASNFQASGWNKLKLELDKCDLLCANCHRLEHCSLSEDVLRLVYDYNGDWELGTQPGIT